MRSLNGAISACGARDAGTSDVSRACRWARWPMLSVNIEQPAGLGLAGLEHEVVDDQLAAFVEQVDQGRLASGPSKR
jgi:hypothetical protein